MGRLLRYTVALAIVAGAGWWFLGRATPLPADALAGVTGDAARGEVVFWAAGCASCHSAQGADGDDLLVLAGGRRFASDFGTFVAPNISPDPDHGIGGWSAHDLASAMIGGVSPDGRHYYPAFPYTSYAQMTLQDAADLHAFMMTLPADATPSQDHDLPFPFTIRAGLGLWKAMNGAGGWVIEGSLTEQERRGRYLAEALAHCGECHTPRNLAGGMDISRWLAGAPNPSGDGRIPNITPAALDWSDADLMTYFTLGFTPEFDTAGGTMAAVVKNLARLPDEDRAAIIAYLRMVRPVD